MSKSRNKPSWKRAVRVNVSLHPQLLEVLPDILQKGGYMGLSDYLQARIRRDAKLEDKLAA